MSNINIQELQRHAGLDTLETHWLNRVAEEAKIVSATAGEQLSSAGVIPSSCLIILSGEARHIAEVNEHIVTLGKYGRGSWIGITSVLSGDGCEWIAASTELKALEIPSTLVVELLKNEDQFREWAFKNITPGDSWNVASKSSQYIELNPLEALGQIMHTGVTMSPQEAIKNGCDIENSYYLLTKLEEGDRPGSEVTLEGLRKKVLDKKSDQALIRVLQLRKDYKSEPKTDHYILKRAAEEQSLFNASSTRIKPITGRSKLEKSRALIQMLSALMRIPFRRDQMEAILNNYYSSEESISLRGYGEIMAATGLHVSGDVIRREQASRLNTPCLTYIPEYGITIVESADASGLSILCPESGRIEIAADSFGAVLPETLKIVTIEKNIESNAEKFGFNWFIPALKKYRGALLSILISSFVIQIFTLANPLLFQIIVDKVITQRSLDSLQALGIALLATTVLDSVLSALRTFLFVETTNRIDIRLGAEIIDHLLRLPLSYFGRRPVGELGTRLAEMEKIRNFLTGQALTGVIDAVFSVIYIAVMLFYSLQLTLVALSVLPIQIGIIIVGAPIYRHQLKQTASANAKTQSHIMEVITGVQTVKAQNAEVISRWKWQERYADYVRKSFQRVITATTLNQISTVLQQISQLMVLWVGAAAVIKGEITLGQLIAFRIIAGYVTTPLLRLTNIWQSVQEIRVSVERLADIIDTPEESGELDQNNIPIPSIVGRIQFDGVSFAFPGSPSKALRNVNTEIPEGSFVGIVGRSGSGKSTLVKLISRLYNACEGKVIIDDYDISKVELYSLRRQIGIVPQDPLLFAGSIRENICLTNPDATDQEIIRAAKVACAHEFIMNLSSGYSTIVGERGSGLSGGQQQRIAIARTLLSNPRLLVLDEATSALDYETERQLCLNLKKELKGLTTLFVTHRLTTVRDADRIIMMEDGLLAEEGSFETLINRKGLFFALYQNKGEIQ